MINVMDHYHKKKKKNKDAIESEIGSHSTTKKIGFAVLICLKEAKYTKKYQLIICGIPWTIKLYCSFQTSSPPSPSVRFSSIPILIPLCVCLCLCVPLFCCRRHKMRAWKFIFVVKKSYVCCWCCCCCDWLYFAVLWHRDYVCFIDF